LRFGGYIPKIHIPEFDVACPDRYVLWLEQVGAAEILGFDRLSVTEYSLALFAG
jgi:hypothetical protein